MNRAHMPSFLNCMPCIYWQSYFPKFKYDNGDDVALYIIKFHMHSHRLKVEWHEDCLMKMFMATLEGKARSWYEQLPTASFCFLNHFHTVFFENFKESNPSLLLVQNCCGHFESFIEKLEILLDEEILEALHDNSFHNQVEMVASLLDENETE